MLGFWFITRPRLFGMEGYENGFASLSIESWFIRC